MQETLLWCWTGLRDSLEWLSLQGCPMLSSRGLESLSSCHKLHYLDLSCTSVVSLHCLSTCTSLRRLRLSGCEQLADGALHSLTHLSALADLDLRNSKQLITATLLEDLSSLPGDSCAPRGIVPTICSVTATSSFCNADSCTLILHKLPAGRHQAVYSLSKACRK